MNLTELLAMPVINLPTARRMGVICAFCVDERVRRVTHVAVVDDENYCRELYYRFGDIRWGQDMALVMAEPVEETPCRIPFRSPIVDTDGVSYAYLKELCCDEKGHITDIVNTLDESLPKERLLRMGDVVLLKGKTRLIPTRKSAQSADTDMIDGAENTPYVAPETEQAADNMGKRDSLWRIAGDYSFLLGRTLKNDLTFAGETVVAKGEIITDDTVNKAREKGLLLALTALSR